jgi:arsenite-transporting ATPase
VRNLVAMDEILRDTETVSMRLVMNPDRMVVNEAMRTFTYLSLYGYLTDAVVVNRIFPEAVEGTYFGAWRDVQREQLAAVETGFAPVPVLRAPYFAREVIGPGMLDELGEAIFAGRDAAARLQTRLSQSLRLDGDAAELRLELPFASKGDVSLKKVGQELIVGVDGQKRTIMLPAALAPFRPASAAFADSALVVRFARV